MAEAPSLASHRGLYQRILARDLRGAATQVDRHLRTATPADVCDHLLLPVLMSAERDAALGRLAPDDVRIVLDTVDRCVAEIAAAAARARATPSPAGVSHDAAEIPPIDVLACAASNDAEVVAMRMLGVMVEEAQVTLDIRDAPPDTDDLVTAAQSGRYAVIVITELATAPTARARHLVKRLHAAAPAIPLVVVRLRPPDASAPERQARLRDAGATAVATTLADAARAITAVARHDRRAAVGY
jgi:hypothetical protein